MIVVRGLGDGPSTAVSVLNTAGAGITSAIESGALSVAGLSASVAIPIIGAALFGITTWIGINSVRNKQKTASTQIAEAAIAKFQENKAAYFAGPRTCAARAVAMRNFEELWSWLVANCDDPRLGSAGQRCISERQRGGIYDSWKADYDPIANDSCVQDSGNGLTDAINQIVSGSDGGGAINPNILIPAGLVLAALVLS